MFGQDIRPVSFFVLCCDNLHFFHDRKLVYAQEADKDRHGRISEISRVKRSYRSGITVL